MNSKWYFSALILLLAVLGVKMEHNSLSNQEIVVQFNSEEISEDQTQNAIAIVKEQLQGIGVENIQIVEIANGGLKITYYSDLTVAEIKDILSGDELDVDYASGESDEDPSRIHSDFDVKSYELSVYEIQTNSDSELDLEGYLAEVPLGKERYLDPVDYVTHDGFSVQEKNRSEKVAYALYGNSVPIRDYHSYEIPEVRAGPLA